MSAPLGTAGPLLPQVQHARKLVMPKRLDLAASFADAVAHRRLITLFPFAMIAGLVVYAGFDAEPSAILFWTAIGAIGACVVIARVWEAGHSAAVLAAGYLAGLLLLPVHGWMLGTPMLAFPIAGTYSGVVDEVLSEGAGERRIVVSHLMDDRGQGLPVRRARLLTDDATSVKAGDKFTARIRLAPVPGPVLPGTFDGQFHAYFDGIGAYGSVLGNYVTTAASGRSDLVALIETARRNIASRVAAALPDQTAAIAIAMTIGDQSRISEETRDVMAASGLAHIYSISGLHLSIVAGGAYWLARLGLAMLMSVSGRRLPAKAWAAVVGLVAAALYFMLAGGAANVPAFRSTLMLGLVFGAVLVGRHALTMRNVALAAIVILFIDPANVFRASFQLSFAAVVALIGWFELSHRPRLAAAGRFESSLDFLVAAALTSLIAGAATVLFSAYHFQQTAPLSVVANMMALPVLTLVIMPFGAIAVALMPLGIEAWFLEIMGWGIGQMLGIAGLVAGWSASFEGNPVLTPNALLFGLVGLAWFAMFKGRERLLGPVVALPLVILFGVDTRPHVLIADSTQAIAVAAGEQMGLMAGRTGSFATEAWADHFAMPIVAQLEGARCDHSACVSPVAGTTMSLVLSADGFAEDCAVHSLIITRLYAPGYCRTLAGVVIDAADLSRGGVHWLRHDGTQWQVRRAISHHDRPWRIRRR